MTDISKWNKEVLNSMGVKAYAKSPNIVRSVGDAKRATLVDGTVVERQDLLYMEGYGFLKCINTELHFVYKLPEHMLGYSPMCTCGSVAGVVGYEAYSKLASPTDSGMIIACIRLLTTKNNTGIGEHADGSHE